MFDSLISSPYNPTPELNANNTHKLVSHCQLQDAIKALAVTINAEYLGQSDSLSQAELASASRCDQVSEKIIKKEIVVLCVMNGGMVFCAHLLPLLNFPLQFDVLQVSRYGDKDVGGVLRWVKAPTVELLNKHILIVDDLIDEGVSLTEVYNYCESKSPSSIKVAVLLSKENTRRVVGTIIPNYIGLSIPDKFIFGFGIDYKNYHRNLLDIYTVED